MAEYINFEAEVKFDSEKDDDNDEISSDSENSFINDQEIGNEPDFYRFQHAENDIEQVTLNRFPFIIDLQAFMSLCFEMNMILLSYGYFLRVFESKKKVSPSVSKK